MNTTRSQSLAAEFLENGPKLQRKTQVIKKRFSHPPEKVFFQFCPTRELDWINGWQCELIYTKSGYVEKDCIFSTPDSNILGPGLWIVTRYEPNRILELVRIIENSVVLHFRIDLADNRDNTCTGVWTLTFTAIKEAGNALVESLGDENPDLSRAVEELDFFSPTAN